MKTICKATDGVSLFIGDALELSDTGAIVGGRRVADISLANAVLFDGVSPPDDWRGGRYSYDGFSWRLADLVRAERALLSWGNAFLSRFTGNRLDAEPLSWERKAAAARAHIAGTASAEQERMLQDEADFTDETLGEISASIARNEQLFARIGPKMTGLRRAYFARLSLLSMKRDADGNPPSWAEYQAILDEAKRAALAEATALGI